MKIALSACALAAGLLVATAGAAPPVLMSVGHVRGHPTARWTLPPDVEPEVIEIATEPTVSTDGYFFEESRVVFDLLEDGQTTWLDDRALPAGSYFVHVQGFDEPCYYADACSIREWSQILPLTIPVQLRKPTISTTRYTYSHRLYVRVVWGGNVAKGQVQLRVLSRGRQLWSVRTTEKLYGSTDTCYWTWRVPRTVRAGTLLTLQAIVRSGGATVATTRTVRAP